MASDGADPPAFALDTTAADDGSTTVVVGGELDLATVGQFADAVGDGLARGRVVIDLRDVTFMDSAGVRALNTALRQAAQAGHELRVRDGMQPGVVQVLELTGMLALLPREDAA